MGGFGSAFAGALQGLGSGLATKGAADLEQRYRMAQENLRQRNAEALARLNSDLGRDATREEYNLRDQNAANQTERETKSTLQINERNAEIRAGEQERDIAARANESEADRRTRIELEQIRQSGNINAIREADRLEREAAAGELRDIVIGRDGQKYAVYRNGDLRPLDIYATDREVNGTRSSSGGSSYMDLLQQNNATGGAAAQPGQSNAPIFDYDAQGRPIQGR